VDNFLFFAVFALLSTLFIRWGCGKLCGKGANNSCLDVADQALDTIVLGVYTLK
jgi:hypothetical protein